MKTNTKLLSDNIANIAKIEAALKDLKCEDVLGLVIYDLPGRDCAAKASNGELKYSELSRYKTEYIDRKSPTSINCLALCLLSGARHCY